MDNPAFLLVQQAIGAWNLQITRVNKLVGSLTDDQLNREVAPGRNTGTYLLGHLAAVHDAMLPILGLGSMLYPELEKIFVDNPDKKLEKPPVETVRKQWTEINSALSHHFSKMGVEDWLQRHTAISEEDFKKEPNRNRLNVLLNRTSHVAYHHGQLMFLSKKG